MSCCYKCENRTVDCHVSCEKYAAEMEENKKKLEERRKERQNREAMHTPAFQRRAREYLNNHK
jgi:hypothetical protein